MKAKFPAVFRPSMTIRILLAVGALCLLIAPGLVQAADNKDSFEHWTKEQLYFETLGIEDGLSQSSVNAIAQDAAGFIWLGTQDGLNRYDGYEFKIFRHNIKDEHSLAHNNISALYNDQAGRLWIGTNEGLDRLEPAANQFLHYSNVGKGLLGHTIYDLEEDPDGVLWVSTEAGMFYYLAEEDRFLPAPFNGKTPTVVDFTITTEGVFWLANPGLGAVKYDPNSEATTFYDEKILGAEHLFINDIYADRQGRVWIGTYQGIVRIETDGSTRIFEAVSNWNGAISHNSVMTFFEDNQGDFWVGTYGGGLNYYDPETRQFRSFQHDKFLRSSLSDDHIASLMQDRSGALWVGTFGGGVSLLNPYAAPVQYYNAEMGMIPNNFVWTFAEDEAHRIWIGGNGGMAVIDRDNEAVELILPDPNLGRGLISANVHSLLVDAGNILWVGGNDGLLARYDMTTGKAYHYYVDATIYDIIHAQAYGLWIATGGNGLVYFDKAKRDYTAYTHDENDPCSLQTNIVRTMVYDEKGQLWVGSGTGVSRFDEENSCFVHYPDPEGTPIDVLSMYFGQGKLWLGSFGYGLAALDPETGAYSHYTTEDGLANDVVYAILPDEAGNLWLSTNAGISRFDPQTENFSNYDMHDGLQSNEFNARAALLMADGEMLFGGINGFNAFYPQDFAQNPVKPKVGLVSVSSQGETLYAGSDLSGLEEIKLVYPRNHFEFEVFAANYIQSHQNQYAYKLEPFNANWQYTGTRRFVQYTNLPGGEYTLQIKAANHDGVWNETGISIPVRVIPPFWQTSWFVALCTLAILLSIWLIYFMRTRSIKNHSRKLAQMVNERTAELENEIVVRKQVERALADSAAEAAVTEERTRLARDLHDAVSQSLYGVTLYAEAGLRLLETDAPQAAYENLLDLKETAFDALREMRLLIYELRPVILEEQGLVLALENRLEAVEKRVGLNIQFEHALEERLPAELEVGLYRIAQEGLNNILKHAQAKTVQVKLWREENSVSLRIQDDGIGFDPATCERNGCNGLRNMRERAAELNAHYEIVAAPQAGVTILVEVNGWEA